MQATFRKCSSNPGSPARPARARDASRSRPRTGALTYAQLDAAATRAARRLSALGVRPGDRVALALPARRAVRRGAARLHAPRRGRGAGRPAPVRGRARARAVEGCARRRRRAAASGARGPPARAARTATPRPRRDRDRRAHLRHDVRAPAGRADVRQLAVERARLGRRARPRSRRALAVHAAAVARRRAVDPPAQRDLRDDRRRCTTASTPRAVAAELRDGGATLVSVVPDDARPPARRRPARPAARCAPRSSAAGRSRRRCSSAPRAAGVPTVTTYGLTEACSQVTTGGPPLFCTRVRIERRRRDPRRRPDGRAAARAATTAGCTPATSARSTRDGHLTVTGRAADTIVTGGENVAPAEVEAVLATPSGGRRRRRPRRRRTPSGASGSSQRSSAPRVPPQRRDELAGYCRVRLARYKVPKVFRFSLDLPRTQSGKLLRRDLEE